jgi:hypothetical protein
MAAALVLGLLPHYQRKLWLNLLVFDIGPKS